MRWGRRSVFFAAPLAHASEEIKWLSDVGKEINTIVRMDLFDRDVCHYSREANTGLFDANRHH